MLASNPPPTIPPLRHHIQPYTTQLATQNDIIVEANERTHCTTAAELPFLAN